MKIRRCGRVITICFTPNVANCRSYLQQLGEYGSFYLSGSQQTYWHTNQQDRLLQFGYNTQIKNLSLGGFPGTTVSPVVNLMLIRCLH
ncbi:fimbria/pilus outer membrane usher protein [Escherichia coli]